MPTKPTEKMPETTEESKEISLDPQKKYLMDQFGNLMEKVGDGFGGPLQEELINRLEQTIADFHEEVSEMMASLKENAEKRHEKLKEIWENPQQNSEASSNNPALDDASDWEKRIENKAAESSPDDVKKEPEEQPKKKGLFGRTKK